MGYRLNLEDRNTVSILHLYRSKTYTSADIDTTDTWIDPSPSTGAKKNVAHMKLPTVIVPYIST